MILSAAALALAPVYNENELWLQGRFPRAALVQDLSRLKVKFVLDGAEVPLGKLSRDLLMAVWMVDQDRGAMLYDVQVPDGLASVRITDETWFLEAGPRVQAPERALGTISASMGLWAASKKPWEHEVAQGVAAALLLLSVGEREAVQGVGLARVAGSPMLGDRQRVATYVADGDGARIEVYDPANAPTMRFIGTPKRPFHPTSMVVLHEIAHAIADKPIRDLYGDHEAQRLQVEVAQKAVRSEGDALNLQIRELNAGKRKDKEAIQARMAAFEARKATLKADVARLNRAVETLGGKGELSPMASAFAREIGGSPTLYGRSSHDEAFAEAFALYHLDPEALELLMPGAVAWFEKGMHLKAP